MQKTHNYSNTLAAILLITLLTPCLSVTVNYEALNSSCLNASSITSSANPIRIHIPTYSLVDIQVDLRHLMTASNLNGVSLFLNISNLDSGLNYTQQISTSISATAYSLYAGSNLQLSAHYSITDSTTELTLTHSYLFENSLSAWLRPPEPLNQQQKSFLFVVTSQDVAYWITIVCKSSIQCNRRPIRLKLLRLFLDRTKAFNSNVKSSNIYKFLL